MTFFSNKQRCKPSQKAARSILAGQQGSVLVIALLVLVLMSLGGITATQRSVTESFTIRNTALHKQNVYLAETAALEGVRRILDVRSFEALQPGEEHHWIRAESTWNDNPGQADASDLDSYPLVLLDPTDPDDDGGNAWPAQGGTGILQQRGEVQFDGDTVTETTLRYYAVGWRDTPGEEMGLSQEALVRTGRVVGVYNSDRYGRKTVEFGLEIER